MLYNFEWTDLFYKKEQFFNKFLKKSAEFHANLKKKMQELVKLHLILFVKYAFLST